MEILNIAPGDIYLSKGDAYLDTALNWSWQLVHSEGMGNFHLNYLQSAIWTFNIAMPANIQAANTTNGVPQVVLLTKITYLAADGSQHVQQGQFVLNVPGATVQHHYDTVWLAVVGVVAVSCVGAAAYRLAKGKRRTR
jgi:hypothetical protein